MSIIHKIEPRLETALIQAIHNRTYEVPSLREALKLAHDAVRYINRKVNKIYWTAEQAYPELMVDSKLIQETIKGSVVRDPEFVHRTLSELRDSNPILSERTSPTIRWYREAYAKSNFSETPTKKWKSKKGTELLDLTASVKFDATGKVTSVKKKRKQKTPNKKTTVTATTENE